MRIGAPITGQEIKRLHRKGIMLLSDVKDVIDVLSCQRPLVICS